MSDTFRFDDEFVPVPPAAVDADPAATLKELLYRIARLEHALAEERVQAVTDQGEMLTEMISLSDDLTSIVERWGVTSNAQDAAIIRGVVAMGKKLLALLKHHQVEAVNTIGQPLNPETTDVVATEVRESMPPDVGLREVQIGYTWPYGILRRAKVVANVATPAAQHHEPVEPADPEAETTT